jgi:pimeloyl-ACP methyl ester carboxylesterase
MRILGRILLGIVLLLVAITVATYVLPLPGEPPVEPITLAEPDGRFLDIGGTRTYVQESGRRTGRAVVLVHGFGGSTYSWRFTRATLAAAGYRVIALDLRGFGLSAKSWDGDHSHAAQATLVLAVMDALGVERAVLVGHSMGGNVVAHVALAAPDRVTALVLVDAAVVSPDLPGGSGMGSPAVALLQVPPVRQVARFAVRLGLNAGTLDQMLRSAYADPTFPTAEDVAAYGEAQRLADWDLALLAVIRDAGANALPGAVAGLGGSRPVLVAWGERDPWIPISNGEALRDAIPGAQWLVVPGAGHLPMEEGRAGFEPGLLAFLAGLP